MQKVRQKHNKIGTQHADKEIREEMTDVESALRYINSIYDKTAQRKRAIKIFEETFPGEKFDEHYVQMMMYGKRTGLEYLRTIKDDDKAIKMYEKAATLFLKNHPDYAKRSNLENHVKKRKAAVKAKNQGSKRKP